MPLYTYTCDDHGQFATWATMAESEAPQTCPTCATPAPRALARPAVGGRGEAGGYDVGGCGDGMCAADGPSLGGGCCGGGACVH